MSAPWSKVEHTTPDKPEVVALGRSLGIDPDLAFAKCCRFWFWTDEQSVDGNDLGVDRAFIDHLTRCPGFSDSLIKVGWLKDRNGRLSIPNFDRHISQSAKKRALASDRQKRFRNAEEVTPSISSLPLDESSSSEGGCKGGTPPPLDWRPTAGFTGITVDDRAAWAAAFPACDLDRQLAEMHSWLMANPTQVKKNYRRFINNWLSRSQDKGGDTKGVSNGSTRIRDGAHSAAGSGGNQSSKPANPRPGRY